MKAAVADSEFAAESPGRGQWRPATLVGAGLALGALVTAAIYWFAQAPEPRAPTAPPAAKAAVPQPQPPAAQPETGAELEALLDVEDEADAIAQLDAETEPPPEPLLTSGQRKRLQAYSPAGQKLLSERLAATRELLEKAPDDAFSIELFVTDHAEPARMERFLLRARDLVPLSELFVIPMAGGGPGTRVRVVYGTFDNAGAALEARRRLPPKYQEAFRTSARSFGELRKQM